TQATAFPSALRRRPSRRHLDLGSSPGQRRLLADSRVIHASAAALGELGEDEERVGRDGDAEAIDKLGDPRQLVRAGRDDGAPQPGFSPTPRWGGSPATVAPPRPPGPVQIRLARTLSRSRAPSSPSRTAPTPRSGVPIGVVTTSAPALTAAGSQR